MPEAMPPSGHVNISEISGGDIDVGPIVTGQVGGDVVGGDQVAGDKVLGDKIVYEASLPPAEARERRDLGILLTNVETTWIKGVLEKSVYEAALLELGKEKRPDAVDHPWHTVLETPDQARQALPPEKKIAEIFAEANRLLLILGEPGSGKTTTLLQLARDLIAEVKQDPTFIQPVPVILNLSTWTDQRQPLEDWLSAELSSKYRVPKKDGRRWLEEKRLLPLLDGLDEVRPENRAACVEKINRLAADYGLQGMVVCSRLKDYTALAVRLQFNSALYLRPLAPEQIDDYFDRAGDKLVSLRTTLQRDETLLNLARSPLMLNIMSLAYQDTSAEALGNPALATDEARRKHLFDTYISRMFRRRGDKSPYDDEQTKARLAWLAQNMQRHNQEVFLIEGLQPSWLPARRWRIVYILTSRLIGGLIGGLLFMLFFSIVFEMIVGGVIHLIAGLLVGLIVGVIDAIRFERSKTNIVVKGVSAFWQAAGNVLFVGLSVVLGAVLFVGLSLGRGEGLLVGMYFGLYFGLIYGLRGYRQSRTHDIKTVETLSWLWGGALKGGGFGLSIGLSVGVILLAPDLLSGDPIDVDASLEILRNWGLIGGLFGAPFGGINSRIVETKTFPNQGIKYSLRNAIFTGLSVGPSVGLIIGLYEAFGGGVRMGLAVGLSLGLIVALWYGGLDVIQHYTLRLILIMQGHTPRHYAQFLDYCVDRIFLQKVGGGYRFIHRLVLEHFAEMG